MTNFKVSLGVFLVLLVVIFTLQNTEVVTTRFLFFDFSLSRALLIFLLFCAGILTGWVMRGAHARSRQRASRGE